MKLNALENEILSSLYEELQDDLVFVAISGSSSLPYINNPDDIDIVFCFKSLALLNNDRSKIKEARKSLKDIGSKIVFLLRDASLFEYYKNANCSHSYLADYDAKYGFPLFAYEFPYLDILFGEDTLGVKQISLLDNKQRMKSALKAAINDINSSKKFYHVLTTLYILKNNSYELTQEQIENINIVHDQENTVRIEELYQEIKMEVNNLQ